VYGMMELLLSRQHREDIVRRAEQDRLSAVIRTARKDRATRASFQELESTRIIRGLLEVLRVLRKLSVADRRSVGGERTVDD
jgi:hypothetical protein